METEKKYVAVDVLKTALNAEIADVVTTYPDYEESGFSRGALNEIIDNIPKKRSLLWFMLGGLSIAYMSMNTIMNCLDMIVLLVE